MGTLNSILLYLTQTAISLYLLLVFLRFLLQATKADFYNPISQFIVKATNPAVIPLRKVIPGFGGLDIASLVLAFALQVLAIASMVLIKYQVFPSAQLLLMGGVFGLLGLALNTLYIALIIMVIVSWIAPGSNQPAIHLVYQITEPVIAPIRKVIPPMGGLDFSVLVLLIGMHVVRIALYDSAAALGVLGVAPWLS
ncbi:YggT family protein [Halioglobus maricola]|uniref:YggT family protein n=1 Tax=Halioglobus maricola TaxID=2601894 RepID=A0A5P9NRH7_9GAMM|nr:YggT family protein [Halioglobus maricola]QFU77608.1 YggT family protein [Halioglobus maricola]